MPILPVISAAFRRRPVFFAGAALFILYFAVVGLKLYHWPKAILFQTDPAFRLRYVAMYAAGEPIPNPDVMAQWPEGLDPTRADFLTQDAVIGLTLRWLNALFHVAPNPPLWVAWHVSAWSTLSAFVVYLWARRLFSSRRGALLAALAYGLALPIYLRTCGSYLREDFVLPFFFLGFYALLRTFEEGGWRWPIVTAASFFVTLVSWHASSFLFFFAAAAAVPFVIASANPERVMRGAAALTAAALIAYAVHPALREKSFLTSPAFAVAVGGMVAAFTSHWKLPWWGRVTALLAACAVAYGVGRPFAAGGEYSHVYTMIFYKLRYLGAKPTDPTALPRAAREIWSGPANSPPLAAVAAQFLGLAVLAAAPLAWTARRVVRGFKNGDIFAAGTATALVLFTSLYALYQRFAVVMVFFVAVWAGGYFYNAARRRHWLWLLIPAIIIPLEGIKAAAYESRPWPWKPLLEAAATASDEGYSVSVGDEQWRLIRWFSAQPDSRTNGVVAPIADSAVILAYAQTPVVLHPIYEAPGMRERVHEVWSALYADEESFYAVCAKYKATYVAYNASLVSNNNRESTRYAEAVTRVPTASCAYRMQFEPGKLAHFAPVFETLTWRVFLVGVPGSDGPDLGPPSPLFSDPVTRGGYYDEAHGRAAYKTIEDAIGVYNDGVAYYDKKDFERARERFHAALGACPRLNGAWDALAWLELEDGDAEAGAWAASRALLLDPYDDAALAALAKIRKR